MTVKELITRLRKENPGAEVVLSRDEEGNSASDCADVSHEYVERCETLPALIEWIKAEEDVTDEDKKRGPVVVIWPAV
jgi:hypothetical protein